MREVELRITNLALLFRHFGYFTRILGNLKNVVKEYVVKRAHFLKTIFGHLYNIPSNSVSETHVTVNLFTSHVVGAVNMPRILSILMSV